MARPLSYINDIKPDSRSWSVKILVEAKGPPQESTRGTTRYQKLTFVDEKGTRIIATIFGLDIIQFEKTLALHDTYIISNAKVRLADPNFNSLGNRHTWDLTKRTVVTKVNDELIPCTIIVPKFESFESLEPKKDRSTVDVLGIIITKFQPRTTVGPASQSYVIHEFVLLNDEKKPIILTLWNSIATSEGPILMSASEPMPIISASKLIVSRYYGISLESTSLTSILVDPAIPQAQKLKIWRANNQEAIKEAIVQVNDIMKTKLQTIADAARGHDGDKFTLKVKVQVCTHKQRFLYIGCGHCYVSYDAELNWEFECRNCLQKTIGTPLEKVFVDISDDTGSLVATAFAENAVKLMNINAISAMEMHERGDPPSVDRMNATIKDKKYVARVKKTMNRSDGDYPQYTISKLIEDKENEILSPGSSASQLLAKISIDTPTAQSSARKRLTFPGEGSSSATASPAKD